MSKWDAQWRTRWEAVLAYRSRTGRWPSEERPDREVRSLGWWVTRQRQLWRRGTLPTDRAQVMVDAGYDFTITSGPAPEVVERVTAAYQAGGSPAASAGQYGVIAPTIREWVRAGGGEVRPQTAGYLLTTRSW